MVLNGDAIRSRNLISRHIQSGFRLASYDIRIGKMFTSDEDDDDEKFVLPPQGVVEVISEEAVTLPVNVIGYAMVRTTLCNEGIFAINIGIIDPGYSGRISSTLVNFGKKPFPLTKDQQFLRLVFHEFQPQEKFATSVVEDDKYIADKRKKMKKYFGSSFLDIPGTAKKVAKEVSVEVFGDVKKTLLWWVPGVALAVALLSFLVNWGANWSAKNVLLDRAAIRDLVSSDLRAGNSSVQDRRIADLERQIGELSQRLAALPQPAPVRPTAAPRQPAGR